MLATTSICDCGAWRARARRPRSGRRDRVSLVFRGVDEDRYESTRHAGTEKSNGWHYTVAFSPYDPETGIVVCLDQNVNEYMRMMDHEYNFEQLIGGKDRIMRPVRE